MPDALKKLRIYLDTSVINFLFADDAPDFRRVTEDFFAKHAHKYELYVSEIVLLEISQTRDPKRREQLLDVIRQSHINLLPDSLRGDVEALARHYLAAKIVPPAKYEDALHAAFATVHQMDILLSWNFKHLANVRREAQFNAVNLQQGCRFSLRLLSPLQVQDET
jgi:predicted nucleic acid-binding protein